ncbi:PAS domain S-box protein [Leptolyngbya sp. PCC 6406]|uniref:PAS domain S-box protein n=1 Tax=Leptolyngbya sp. PCC 6406 TaxID=1173264 RepID=UPI0002ACA16A|nr:PAS domain S-box protein [Leptolyngbya sp. PCC 6406]
MVTLSNSCDGQRPTPRGYRTLYERTPALLWTLRPNGTIALVSDYWLKTLGYSRKQVVGQPAIAFIDPPARSAVTQAWQGCWQGDGEPTTVHCNLVTSEGTYRPITWSVSGIRDTAGQPSYATVAMADCSASQQLLQTILDTLPQRVFWKDVQGRFLGCNRQFAEDMGRSDPAQIIGKTDEELGLSPQQISQYRRADEAVIATGRPHLQVEHCQNYPDGLQRWVRTNKVPLRQSRGGAGESSEDAIVGVVGAYEDILTQKQTEQSLHRYVQMVEAANDGICLVDRNYRYQVANQTYTEWYGEDGQSILGRTVAEVLGRDAFIHRLQPLLKRCLAGETIHYARWFDFPHLGRRFRSVTCIPYAEANGEVSGFVTTIRDLTDLKLAMVRQQELLEIIESTADFIGMATLDGRVIYLNPALEGFLGKSASSQLGESGWIHQGLIQDFYPSEAWTTLLETGIPTAIATGTWRGESALISAAGEVVPVSQVITAHQDDSGMVSMLSTTIRDIRDRKQLENTLRRQQHYFQALTEQASEIVVITRDQDIIQYVSPAVERNLGYTPQALVGRHVAEYLHPEDQTIVLDRMRLIVAQPGVNLPFITYRLRHQNGSWRTFESSSINLLHDPIVHGIVTHCRDVTDRVRAEKALRHVIEGTAALTGEDFFDALAQHLATALGVVYVLISEVSQAGQLSTLAFWSHNQPQSCFTYVVNSTPCERTLRQGYYLCPQGVMEAFPADLDLVTMQAQSYVGVALVSRDGETLGEICVLDTRPMADPEYIRDILQIFAARATAELERQRSNSALQASEVRFQRLAANMPGIICRYHTYPDGRDSFSYVSAACRNLWGLDPETVYADSRSVWALVHPDDVAGFSQSIQVAIDQGTVWSYEHRIMHPSGQIKWFQAVAKPEPQPDGSWIWDGLVIEISDRKQTEAALRQSEAVNQAIINALPDMLIRQRIDGKCLDLSYPPDYPVVVPLPQAKGGMIQDMLPASIVEQRLIVAACAIATGRTQIYEFQIAVADQLRWEEARIVPLTTDEVLILVRDIDERKRAEEEVIRLNQELARQNQHLEQLVEQRTAELMTFINALPDQIFVVDRATGQMPLGNEAVAAAAGRRRNQFEGHTVAEIFAPEQAACYERQNHQVFTTGEIFHIEETMDTAQGKRFVDTYKIPLRRPNGEVYALIGTSRDITDRVKAQKALTAKTRQLEAANRELESFSYSVSHDLRAPLRHINGFIAALQRQLGPIATEDAKISHYIGVIQRSSLRMEQLIDGLLTLSRAGRRELKLCPVDLGSLVEASLALLNLLPPETGDGSQGSALEHLSIQTHPLPTVNGDSALLQQVFTNLLENAVKFSRDATPARITIGCRPDGVLYVQDNGIGFDMTYADKLFSPFQRLHSGDTFQGMGIGLAIVQRIIHRHGGRIWAESAPNQGTTMFFTLEL